MYTNGNSCCLEVRRPVFSSSSVSAFFTREKNRPDYFSDLLQPGLSKILMFFSPWLTECDSLAYGLIEKAGDRKIKECLYQSESSWLDPMYRMISTSNWKEFLF